MSKIKWYYAEQNIRLYCGDNLNLFNYLKDKSIKLLFADPPYGIGLDYDSPFEDTFEYYEKMTERLLTQGLRVADTMVVTPGGYTNVEYWKDKCREKKIDWFRFCWYKGAMPHRSKVGFAHWEEVLIFGKMYAGIPDYIYANPESEKEGHACPKPEKLLAFFIEGYTKTGEIVFDPFTGSGTTLSVAKALGRKGLGAELSKNYCEISANKIAREMEFTPAPPPPEQLKMEM